MKYKILAIDMDGTTVDDNNKVSPENIKAFKAADENGVLLVPVTGRTYFEIPEEVLNESSIKYTVYSNGAGIYKQGGEIIFSAALSDEKARKIFALLNSYETMIELYTDLYPVTDEAKINEESYKFYNIDPIYTPVITQTRKGIKDFNDYGKNLKNVEMFNVFFKYENERQEAFKILREDNELEVTTSMENNIEIMRKNVNKGSTLKELCDMLKINKDEVIAVGDSKNDLTMFSFAGTRLAVSNACDELKALSSDIICSNNESAISFAVNKYILGE